MGSTQSSNAKADTKHHSSGKKKLLTSVRGRKSVASKQAAAGAPHGLAASIVSHPSGSMAFADDDHHHHHFHDQHPEQTITEAILEQESFDIVEEEEVSETEEEVLSDSEEEEGTSANNRQ
jgi:hypothetical protein